MSVINMDTTTTASCSTPGTPAPSIAMLPPVSHRFAELARSRPDLSIAQIINSNNYSIEDIQAGKVDLAAAPKIPETADAVVVGAGVAGLMYAIHLKKIKPDAEIVVLERSAQPTYKIGESTLSPFSRFCMSHIMSIQYMLRLFNLKEGLDFVHVDESGKNTFYHDIGGLDYSFQLERKVSEMLLTLKAQRMGVKVFYGVSVDGRKSDLSPELATKLIHFSLNPSVHSNTPTSSPLSVDKDGSPRRHSNDGSMCVVRPNAAAAAAAKEAHHNHFGMNFFRASSDLERRGQQIVPVQQQQQQAPVVAKQSKSGTKMSLFSRLFNKNKANLSAPITDKSVADPAAPNAAPSMIHARVVADASGLAHTMAKQVGVETKKFDGIDFDAYWAYFREDLGQEETYLQDFMYCATNHLCMKDGWSWWIRLVSWEKSPRANLMDLITFLLDNYESGVDEREIPCIDDLARTFGCTHDRVVSIGFTIRTESVPTLPTPPTDVVDPEKASENERRFWGIVCKYPVIERILLRSGRYELCQKYYGSIFGTYFARKNMSFYQTKVAGPGWFSMGNAGGFTSPLFSPGINCLALPAAWLAATLTKRHLETGEQVWDQYQQFLAERHVPGLRNVDRLLYNMFRDGRLFMAIFPIFYGNGMGNINKNYTETFSEHEIGWGNGCSEEIFREVTPQLFPLIEGSALEPVSDETVEKVREICEKYRKIIVERYSAHTKYSLYMRHFDDNLHHTPAKLGRLPGDFGARRCGSCHHPNAQHRTWCISCGVDLPPMVLRPFAGVEIVLDSNKLRGGLEAQQQQQGSPTLTSSTLVSVEEAGDVVVEKAVAGGQVLVATA
ncbi:hypothetical protein HDU96_009082 [Phlyctochytrium bullatum]|nr:hypothetical protein HDU96_009082 [Phlyctochytrium bullatum]